MEQKFLSSPVFLSQELQQEEAGQAVSELEVDIFCGQCVKVRKHIPWRAGGINMRFIVLILILGEDKGLRL